MRNDSKNLKSLLYNKMVTSIREVFFIKIFNGVMIKKKQFLDYSFPNFLKKDICFSKENIEIYYFIVSVIM